MLRFSLKKLLILDRDGVINQPPAVPHRYILTIQDLILNRHIVEIIIRAQSDNWFVCCATNQQAIGKNILTYQGISAIHNYVNENIVESGGRPLHFFVCPHLQSDLCFCRKPKPGLILQALETYGLNKEMDQVIFVGDQETDKLSAEFAGVKYLPFSNSLNYSDIIRKHS